MRSGGGDSPSRITSNCQHSLTEPTLSSTDRRIICNTTKVSRTRPTWRTIARSTLHWHASNPACCLVSRKSVSMDQAHLAQNHLGEVRPQVVRDDVLVVGVTVSGHDQPQGTVLGSVDVDGYCAHPEALAPLQRQRPGQLAHGTRRSARHTTIVLG